MTGLTVVTTVIPGNVTAVVEEATEGTTVMVREGEVGVPGRAGVLLGKGVRNAELELNNGIEKERRGKADVFLIDVFCHPFWN